MVKVTQLAQKLKLNGKTIIHAVGKRKLAVARVYVKEGNGRITINGTPLNLWGTPILRARIQEVLEIAKAYAEDELNKYDIKILASSGGLISQAEAIRVGIARALSYLFGAELKKIFESYDKYLIVYDPRRCEPHRSNQRGASEEGSRRHKQRSKR